MTVALIVSLVVLAASVYGCDRLRDDLNMPPLWLFLVAIAAALGVFVFAMLFVSRHYDRVACSQYGEQTGRSVRFRNLTPFSWDCFTRDNHGRWIPRDQLRSLK